jgi:hydrogenase maturation protein HypF
VLQRLIADLGAGTPVATLSAAFHRAVADAVRTVVGRIRERTRVDVVALSGGVFQNVRLLDLVVRGLEHDGCHVLTHHLVPPNDGGLALGQVACAAFQPAPGRVAGAPIAAGHDDRSATRDAGRSRAYCPGQRPGV